MRLCGEKGTDDGGEGEDVAEQFCFVLRDVRCTSFEAAGSAGAGVLMNSINLNDINIKIITGMISFLSKAPSTTTKVSQLLICYVREEREKRKQNL